MAGTKLNPSEISQRLNNIENIYQDYIKKIRNIRGKEENILADYIKKMEARKITEIRQAIKEEYK